MPLLVGVEIQSWGTLFLSELCLLALLPVALLRHGRRLLRRDVALLLALGLVYLTCQMVTDVVRASAPADYLRGWSRILVLFSNFLALVLLIRGRPGRIAAFAAGSVVGHSLALVIQAPLAEIGWKFGFAGPVTTAVLLLCALPPVLRSAHSLLTPALLAALGLLSLYLDFRSWALALFMSGAFLLAPALQRRAGFRLRPLSPGRAALVVGLLGLAAFGTLKLYSEAARQDWLGPAAEAKYEAQAALGDLGILLGGRSEGLVSIQAIQDAPFLGHGSWAQGRHYAELEQMLLYQLGFVDRIADPKTDLIPTHSHLLGAWVEAGLGGALFWLGVLVMIANALRRLYAADDPLRPFAIFLLILFVWDILFSPFGAFRRLSNAFILVVMLYGQQLAADGANAVPDRRRRPRGPARPVRVTAPVRWSEAAEPPAAGA